MNRGPGFVAWALVRVFGFASFFLLLVGLWGLARLWVFCPVVYSEVVAPACVASVRSLDVLVDMF